MTQFPQGNAYSDDVASTDGLEMLDQKPVSDTRTRFDGGEFKYLALKDQQLQRLRLEIQKAVESGALIAKSGISEARLAILMDPEAFSLLKPTFSKEGVLLPRKKWKFKDPYHQQAAADKRKALAEAFEMTLEELESRYPIYKLLGRRRNNIAAQGKQIDPDLLWLVVRWEPSTGRQFGREHKALREQLGLSHEEMAASYDVQNSSPLQFSITETSITRIENEGRFPIGATAQVISNAFGMSENDFELMLRRSVNDPAVRALDHEPVPPLSEFLPWFQNPNASGLPSEQQEESGFEESDFWDWATAPPEHDAALKEWAAYREQPNVINRANEGIPEVCPLPEVSPEIERIVALANEKRGANDPNELRVQPGPRIRNRIIVCERGVWR